jgi:uncharacterized membrane protein YeaQ/YmgE (transglycosylase-associated protein family)
MAFGLLAGLSVRLLLPGHHGIGLGAAALLSLAGAAVGGFAGELLLPGEMGRRAGFAVSAIGALAVLLVYGIAA